MGHALYPLIWSCMTTIVTFTILFAQLQRKQVEGTPINFGVLKLLTMLCVVMWAGTGVVALYYHGKGW